MRLDVIRDLKRRLSTGIQEFPAEDISERIHEQFRMRPREPVRRILARLVAGMVLSSQQASIRHSIGTTRIPFQYDLLCLGERLASDASVGVLLGKLAGSRPRSVLIPGCYLGAEDVQFWLRRGVRRAEGIDVYSLASRWAVIVPELEREFRARVRFQQASVESIPFEDASFDLISTSAVLEHVRNLNSLHSS